MNSTLKMNLACMRIFKPSEVEEMVISASENVEKRKKGKISYFNIPCSFDIETSSFYAYGEKQSCMYAWVLGINGLTMIGRTWDDFVHVFNYVHNFFETDLNNRLLIYVHNLAYDFQFFRKWLNWDKVFTVSSRKLVYAVTDTGIEFRCSYILTGKSLEKIGNELKTYPVKKLVGDLDYDLIRHSNTPLTDKEIGYINNDAKVVMSYIGEQIEAETYVGNIPLTKTGYVRRYVKECCFYEDGNKKSLKKLHYREVVGNLKLTVKQYKQLKRCFQGGFTHANPFNVGKVLNDVSSDDFISSYPYVMVSEQFPMGNAEPVALSSTKEFYQNLKLYCCMFDVKIDGLMPKFCYYIMDLVKHLFLQ